MGAVEQVTTHTIKTANRHEQNADGEAVDCAGYWEMRLEDGDAAPVSVCSDCGERREMLKRPGPYSCNWSRAGQQWPTKFEFAA